MPDDKDNKQENKLLKETVQFLGGVLKETAGFAVQMGHSLANTQIDPKEGNLYNALNGIEAEVKGFLAWMKEREEQAKKEEEEAKEKAKQGKGKGSSSFSKEDLNNLLKSDTVKQFLGSESIQNILNSDAVKGILNSDLVTNLIGSEFVSNTLKQYSDVIKENADLIKKIAPKNLSDKLLSFAVPAETLSKEIKNPENVNKSINQVLSPQKTINNNSVKNSPQNFKAIYDSSKDILDKNPNNLNDPKVKNASRYMALTGFALMSTDPVMAKSIQADFKEQMIKNPAFREAAVNQARSRLKTLNPNDFNRLSAQDRKIAETDIKAVITGTLLDGVGKGASPANLDKMVEANFNAFLKDPAKGLQVLTNKTVTQNAAQRMTYAANNQNRPHAVSVSESPISAFDDDLKAGMLKSRAFRDEKIMQAQNHLKSVLDKTGVNTKEGIEKLPKEVQAEIGKDLNTIFFGQTVNAALQKEGKFNLTNQESIDNFVKNPEINGLVDKYSNAMFTTPKADFQSLTDYRKTGALANKIVGTNENKELFTKALSNEPKENKFTTEFNENTKTDMIKSREVRAESVISARKNIKDILDKNQINQINKESLDKLSPEAKKSLEDSIKTIGFAYAAEKGLSACGKNGINDPKLQAQLANSQGLNWAADNTLAEFYKNPQQGLRTLFDNKQLQKMGQEMSADFVPEIANVVKSDIVPNKEFLVNPDLGVNKQQSQVQNQGIAKFDDNLKKDMLKSGAFRDEKINQATAHFNSMIEKYGDITTESMKKLPQSVQDSINNDLQTIAFGVAAKESLALEGKQNITNPKVQEELINSDAFKATVTKTEDIYKNYLNNSKQYGKEFNYKEIQNQLNPTLKENEGNLKSIVQHDQVVNEAPLESFDDNLKTDMLKSKAFRAEKMNEAQQHIKSVLEENNVKTNDEYAKLPDTVRQSLDKDIKTIVYGHTAEEALKRNGLESINDESIQNKFVNSELTNKIVDNTLAEINKNPMKRMGTVLDNNSMQMRAKEVVNNQGADFTNLTNKDIFNDDIKKQMLSSKSFREQKIADARNNLQGILDKTGPMTEENYSKMTPAMQEAYDANLNTLMYGQFVNSALESKGLTEVSDPRVLDNMLNSEQLNKLVEHAHDDIFDNPETNMDIALDNKMGKQLADNTIRNSGFGKEFDEILSKEPDKNMDIKADADIKLDDVKLDDVKLDDINLDIDINLNKGAVAGL